METSGSVANGREGQTFGGQSLLSRYASLVKLPHTLFALPFAGVGALLASYTYLQNLTAWSVFWIILAFTNARFAAMAFNRLVDHEWDARNPRTAMRELPAGKLTRGQALISIFVTSTAFVASAWQLNELCGMLSFVALAWTFFYSYTKRFTSFSHWVLGLSLAIAPVGAYLAIAGEWAQPWFALLVLAGAVMCWVAGFDIVYSIQDIEFDRTAGLHSMPSKLGMQRSLLLARVLHVLAVTCFAAIALFELFPVGVFYKAGLAVMVGLLIYEHSLIRSLNSGQVDYQRIDKAFFTMNVLVSTTFFLFTLLDRVFTA